MKNNLFGQLGGMLKGNWVMIILCCSVVAAGALSFYTVNDINERLDNQQLANPDSQSELMPEEDAQDVHNEAENVPLKPAAKPTNPPKATPSPTIEPSESGADGEAEKDFILPVDGKIFAAFSGDELVYNSTMDDWRTHNGIDIKAAEGSAVKASCDGRVSDVYNDGMLGWVVEVEADGCTVRYCGLSSNVSVKKGEEIRQGRPIGTVGEVPLELAEDSHIHLEILQNGEYQNPDKLLK